MLKRRLDLWLPTFLLSAPGRFYTRAAGRRKTQHIVFLVCDHFEPRHGIVREEQAGARVQQWAKDYAAFRLRCQAAFGLAPKHTWFYPPHHGYEHLPDLARMTFDGLGEVELHFHHHGDNSASLRAKLQAALQEYHRWGLLLESGAEPRTAFAFIHGDWALDNSAHGKFCGVNDELSILQELGCWGDFTMPSANECQTRKINSIYYATDDPERPKSHDWGRNARAGRTGQSGLFMMQGPLGINWRAPGYPRIENASLTSSNWGRPDRARMWLDCHVHVKGRPEWVFVKLHTHGAVEHDFDALFGDKAFAMHRWLNEKYNDGERYRLHYVTAREAYNIAKAAEAGESGDPGRYRDTGIAPYANTYYCLDAPHRLAACTRTQLRITDIQSSRPVRVSVKPGPITGLQGKIQALEIDAAAGTLRLSVQGPDTPVELEAARGFAVVGIEGGRIHEHGDKNGMAGKWIMQVDGETLLRFRSIGEVP